MFLALDLRSVRRVRKWGFSSFERDGVQVRVLSIPLGNIPKKIFYPIGEWGLKMLYRRAVRELIVWTLIFVVEMLRGRREHRLF